MDETKYPWQKAYFDALVELDPNKLTFKIEEAYKAIRSRMKEPVDDEEMQALDDAFHGLGVLKRPDKRLKENER